VQLQRDLGLRDLSEPAGGPHAIQILIGQAVEGLSRAWNCEVRWCRGPRIVPVADNYDRLGYPAETITRDTRYTRYVDAGNMLRSHSSAMIPPALRRLARQSSKDVLLVCPGIVYRRPVTVGGVLPGEVACPIDDLELGGAFGQRPGDLFGGGDGGDGVERSD